MGAAARSYGSLGDPNCDSSRNTLAELDNARGRARRGWGCMMGKRGRAGTMPGVGGGGDEDFCSHGGTTTM